MPTPKLVPIRAVCAMYGLNPNTLRTWERRYGIVDPKRTDGGHRGFGEGDLANIELMLRLLREGKSTGEAADITLRETRGRKRESQVPGLQGWRQRLRTLVKSFDTQGAVETASAAIRALGYRVAVEQVLFPELVFWGDQWEKSTQMIAQEHHASLVVRSALLLHQDTFPAADGATRVLTLACVPGEQHDLPLLHVANLLREDAVFRPLLLVAGLPISELISASTQARAEAIVLSATLTPRPEAVRAWITELIAAGWEERTILVGSGFGHTRVYSETRVKAAPGSYDQLVSLLKSLPVG